MLSSCVYRSHEGGKKNVVKKILENNEKLVLDHLYIYSGEMEPFKSVGIEDRSEPYFFLLDADGRVVWSGSGSFRQEYLDRMEEILSQ